MIPTLLSIPAEIRLHIYGYCIPLHSPLTSPTKEWSGLVYACKTIKLELESEICKHIANCIEILATEIRSTGDDIIFTPPTTLSGWLDLTVSRPKIRNMFGKDDPFLQFQEFHFRTFTITFHDDANGYEYYKGRPSTYQEAASSLAAHIGKYHPWQHIPAMQKWVLDWSAYPQFGREDLCNGLHKYGTDAWDMDTRINDQGMLMGVYFFRTIPGVPRKSRVERFIEEEEFLLDVRLARTELLRGERIEREVQALMRDDRRLF